jgi:transposase
MNYTTVGVDIAKNVMQMHWVEPETGEVINRSIKRAGFLEHFANRTPCLIGMEACGGSQHWARRLIEMGHQVKLVPAKFAKAFNIGNKNDAADARAIWMATQMPSKSVAVKTEAQQAVLALHRMRQQKLKFRTMQINSLRGLLTEYGEVMGKSRAALDKAIPHVLARLVRPAAGHADRVTARAVERSREPGPADRRHRTPSAELDEREQCLQGDCRDSGRRPADSDRGGRDNGGCKVVQIRA